MLASLGLLLYFYGLINDVCSKFSYSITDSLKDLRVKYLDTDVCHKMLSTRSINSQYK